MQENKNSFIYEPYRRDIFGSVIALVLTFLVHFCVFYFMPTSFSSKDKKEDLEELKLQILPPKARKSLPDFIEANPYANQDTPRADAPESFQNQRATDELPDPNSKSKLPYVGGELKDGKKIVQGTSSPEDQLNPQNIQNVLERPLAQQAKPTEVPSMEAKKAQTSEESQAQASNESSQVESDLQGGEKTIAEDSQKKESGNVEKSKPNATASQKGELAATETSKEGLFQTLKTPEQSTSTTAPKEGKPTLASGESKDSLSRVGENMKKNSASKKSEKQGRSVAKKPIKKVAPKPEKKLVEKAEKNTPQEEQLPAPKPRPMLSMKIPAGPLADNKQRASERGVVAVDSRFSEFGAYQQRMIEAISRQWNLLGSKYDLGTAIGTQVIIEYSLNTQGELVRCEILFTNSTNTGAGLCEQSILTTAPYGAWTQEMINALGTQEQSVRITFHYR